MRFTVVNQSLPHKSQKQEEKDTETRQSSGTKVRKQSSFLEMVRNSYDFYLSIGKDKIKEEQTKIAVQKKQKLNKLIKKEDIQQKRNQQRQKQTAIHSKQQSCIKRAAEVKSRPIKKQPQPLRRSQRSKTLPFSYCQTNLLKKQKQLFDVLDIEENQFEKQKKQAIPTTEERKLSIVERIQKIKQQFIFQDEGTYQISVAHEALLREQKFIDEHINFKHEIREINFVELSNVVKYLKSHGFATFSQNKFYLLLRINPYLYNISQASSQNSIYIKTYKLNGFQIENRLQSTRKKMSQVSIPELFT